MTDKLEREKLAFEKLKHLRDRWWHEDHLVHQRLTWLLTSQTLLFAALAWLVPLREDDDLWIWMIILGGLLTAFAVFVGIMAAKHAQDNLLKKWPKIREGINHQSRVWGALTSTGLPLIFMGAWLLASIFLKIEEVGVPHGVYKVSSHHDTENLFLICKSSKIPKCFEEAEKTCARRNKDVVWSQGDIPNSKPQLVRVGDRETMLNYRCK